MRCGGGCQRRPGWHLSSRESDAGLCARCGEPVCLQCGKAPTDYANICSQCRSAVRVLDADALPRVPVPQEPRTG